MDDKKWKDAIELNKWRQQIEPTIKILRDQLRDQLAPIKNVLDNHTDEMLDLRSRLEKTRVQRFETNAILPQPNNRVIMPKFIEVQNLDGDYYINADHIARIYNTLCGDQFVIRIILSTPDSDVISIYWDTEKEADKYYKKLKKALRE